MSTEEQRGRSGPRDGREDPTGPRDRRERADPPDRRDRRERADPPDRRDGGPAGGRSRRGLLRAVAFGGVAGLAGVTGCLGAITGSGRETVEVLAAGSLQHALETGLVPAVDVPVRVEAHGSATVARLVAGGQRDPDVVTVADPALFAAPLSPAWYATFAGNAVVLAYDADSEGGRRVAAAGPDRWYEPLLAGSVALGRTDPDRDPLGYRTLFALELAARYYDDAPALRERIPRREQVYPETGLIAGFETGSIEAAFAYRSMAEERGYDYVDLPAEVNLSDPAHAADWYSTVSYELPGGRTVRGDAVAYASTVRRSSDAVLSVFEAHTTGGYLAASGFTTGGRFPRFEGDVPASVRRATGGADDRGAVGDRADPGIAGGAPPAGGR